VSERRHAPAAARNAAPIEAALREVLPPRGLVLELASGSGQHAIHLAGAFPALAWQPSDVDPDALASIRGWAESAGLANLRPPIVLDAGSERWPVEAADVVLCINMIHISPWSATLGLLRGAARVLPAGGLLATYGPYRWHGVHIAPSNEAFDASLRARDRAWGVRDVDDLLPAAAAVGLAHERTFALPANNHLLAFRRG
jgi:SAM-dependent methyltransferase